MANGTQSPKLRRPPLEESFNPVIDDTILVWLDTCKKDFEKFRDCFCTKWPASPKQWLFFENTDSCYKFIEESAIYPQNVILVTAGSLGQPIIENLHDSDHLEAIYIYCQNLPKYKTFSESYRKILGVYSNPIEIFSRLREYLDRKNEQTRTSSTSTISSFTSNDDTIEHFSQPNSTWNPWLKNNGTRKIPSKGQLTIAIIQNDSIPFEIILSNAPKYSEIKGENKYSIILSVDKNEAKLSSFINDEARSLYTTDEYTHILPSTNNNNQEYTYWMTFCKETLTIIYGFGEIRPKFKIFELNLDNKDRQLITNIGYLHFRINDVHENFSAIHHLKDKIRFLTDPSSFIEPNLLVLPQPQILLMNNNHLSSWILLSKLPESCRTLYQSLIHFKLDDEDFPDFIQAIEYSIKNPHGWCHQRLVEKAKSFGKARKLEKTYIRLNLQSIIIEIWPPGHYSLIHNHKNAYGMFRTLHGSILIRLYPALTLQHQYETPIEYLLHKDQITWMSPKLNQTHQMRNVELNSCCIILQSYKYEEKDKEKDEELFDYIDYDGRTKSMKPTSDIDFGKFKDQIRKEWNEQTT